MGNFLENFSGELVFTTHKQADPDGVACAVALKEHFGGGRIVVQSLRREGRRMLEGLGVDFEEREELPEAEGTIVVDCLSLAQTGFEKFSRPVGMIDHHFSKERKADFVFFEERPSCAEMVAGMVDLTPLSSRALLAGIISDTRFFRLAVPETFSAAARLAESAGVEEAASLIFAPSPIDKRLALLKAAKRLKIRMKEPLFVVSEVGSYEADAARALVRMGADVAVVSSRKGSSHRISVRAREVGLHFGRMMERFAREKGGEGGGHDRAATMNLPGDFLSEFVSAVKDELSE